MFEAERAGRTDGVYAESGFVGEVGPRAGGIRLLPNATQRVPSALHVSLRTFMEAARVGGQDSQFERRVLRGELALDELLDAHVVFGDEVDRILLLICCPRRTNRFGALKDERARLAGELDGELEDRAEVGRIECSTGHRGSRSRV